MGRAVPIKRGRRPEYLEKQMRYLDGESPNPDLPYSASMHDMITLSMVIALVIGICLFFAGRHGKILWMKVWSIFLVILSIAYLIA